MKLSLVSGLCVMAVMLTPQASSAATLAPQSMLPAATAVDGSLVGKATHYRRYDDDRAYEYRRRYYDDRDDGYRRRYDDDRDYSYRRRNYDYRYYRYNHGDRSYDHCRWERHKCASRWGWGGWEYRRCLGWRGCGGGGPRY